jgi:uncharacterized protein
VTDTNLQTARRLYEAFGAQDARALLEIITPDFHGVVTDGMPIELGGAYQSAERMLRDCWARVFASFDIRPAPDEFLPVAPDRVVVLGRYRGTARATGRSLSAAFAHVLRVTDGRVSELLQVTDTVRWREALAP